MILVKSAIFQLNAISHRCVFSLERTVQTLFTGSEMPWSFLTKGQWVFYFFMHRSQVVGIGPSKAWFNCSFFYSNGTKRKKAKLGFILSSQELGQGSKESHVQISGSWKRSNSGIGLLYWSGMEWNLIATKRNKGGNLLIINSWMGVRPKGLTNRI